MCPIGIRLDGKNARNPGPLLARSSHDSCLTGGNCRASAPVRPSYALKPLEHWSLRARLPSRTFDHRTLRVSHGGAYVSILVVRVWWRRTKRRSPSGAPSGQSPLHCAVVRVFARECLWITGGRGGAPRASCYACSGWVESFRAARWCNSTKRLSQDGTCGFRPVSARKTEVPGPHDQSPLTTITGSVPSWNVLHRSRPFAGGDSLRPVTIERIWT